jgi:hypothetical protein
MAEMSVGVTLGWRDRGKKTFDALGETLRRDSQALDSRRSAGLGCYMIRIYVTQAAFDAVAKILPLGSVGFVTRPNADGERQIWLEPAMVDKLSALRGPRESYSDVILRLAALQSRATLVR